MLRVLLAIAGMLTGLALWAAPALAHGPHRAVANTPIIVAEQETVPAPRICLFSQNTTPAAPAPTDAADNDAPPHEADPAHNPADHSHPPGEDTHHQKAAHGALDAAHEQRESDTQREALQHPLAPQSTERVCGIDVTPPVPPPLG